MRFAAAMFLFFTAAQASELDKGEYADLVTDGGEARVLAVVKRKGEECPTNVTKACKPGQPCFANVVIDGDAARALYLMLKTHGVKKTHLGDDYVGTRTGAMTCTEFNGKYDCSFGYDAVKNVLTEETYCEGD
jgi:hypothetical protein